MTGKKIKVIIIDDSIMFRETLRRGISGDPFIEVVETASDPYDATEKIQNYAPDVLTLDVEMPRMNGIEFLKKLIPQYPVPVVVVSSLPINVFEALDAGAVDFVRKPAIKSPKDMEAFISELITKIKIASAAKVGQKHAASRASYSTASFTGVQNKIIAIGASTGGTEATQTVIKDLPITTPGIVIVQHMPANFTRMYAERLDKICKMSVKEAKNGDRVSQGQILIAPGEFQMRLAKDSSGYYVKVQQGEKVSGHCPSVDVLFESVADVAGDNAIGVILTGMGSDGAKGLLKMRKAGAHTIGQDKASSVVYGMPMVAFNIGAVEKQVSIDDVAQTICSFFKNNQKCVP